MEGIQIRAVLKPRRKEGLVAAKENALRPQQVDHATDLTRLDAAAAKLKVDVGQIDNLARPIHIVAVGLDDHQVRVAQGRLPQTRIGGAAFIHVNLDRATKLGDFDQEILHSLGRHVAAKGAIEFDADKARVLEVAGHLLDRTRDVARITGDIAAQGRVAIEEFLRVGVALAHVVVDGIVRRDKGQLNIAARRHFVNIGLGAGVERLGYMKAGDMGVHVDDRLLRQVGLGADQQRLDTQLFNVFAQQS